MNYTSPLRRRARAARRIARALVRRRLWASGLIVPTYWWDGHPNFGDAMTAWILPAFGVLPIHRVARHARLSGVGSVIEFLPPGFDGAIWGSGLMRDREYPLPDARTLAVRGELTRERIGAPAGVALGDPGLLASRLMSRPAPRWDVGLVPHGHHRGHRGFLDLASSRDRTVRVIDVHRDAAAVVREIAACSVVVTTSLHGLVTADAFGIPAVWTTLEPPLEGGDFKFHDYETVFPGAPSRFVPFTPGTRLDDLVSRAAAVDAGEVSRLCDALLASLAALPAVDGVRRFPSGSRTTPAMRA